MWIDLTLPDYRPTLRAGRRTHSFQTCAEILSAVVSMQKLVRDQPSSLLKPRSEAIFLLREMSHGSKDTCLVFMYRDPVKTIASYVNLLESRPHMKQLLPKFADINIQDVKNVPSQMNVALLTSRFQSAVVAMDLLEVSTVAFLSHIAV